VDVDALRHEPQRQQNKTLEWKADQQRPDENSAAEARSSCTLRSSYAAAEPRR
jgi:hypothetical protein